MVVDRIGVFGGTFDPIHRGHLALAEAVRATLDLDRVYVIPAANQPLKPHGAYAAAHHRLAMTQIACANHPLLVASDIDIRRPPPTYTIETLREIRRLHNDGAALWFLIGSDSLLTFPRWYAAAEILTLARLAVIHRPGVQIDRGVLEQMLPGMSGAVDYLDCLVGNISSTELRHRLKMGESVADDIPDAVAQYITHHGLYR